MTLPLPDQTLPTTAAPFAAALRWGLPARYALLMLGLFLYGLALRLMLNAGLGLAPWEALHLGLAHQAQARGWPLSIGLVSILTGVVIVALSTTLLREKIGPGTLLNVIFIGVWLDLLGRVVPLAGPLPLRLAFFGAGLGLLGVATGVYVAARLGAGPRDGLVLGLRRVTGWPVAPVRTGVEALVVLLAWLVGGSVGWGTLAFAVGVGPCMAFGLGLFGLRRGVPAPAE